MQSILDIYGADNASKRFECPRCGSSRGVSLTPGENDTGLAHCFTCDTGWTGAQLYVAWGLGDMADALEAFGVESDPSTEDVAKHRRNVAAARRKQRQRNQERVRKRTLHSMHLYSEAKRIRPYLSDDQQELLDFWMHDEMLQHPENGHWETERCRPFTESISEYIDVRNQMLDRLVAVGDRRAREERRAVQRLEHLPFRLLE